MKHFLGIDIGSTSTKAVLMDWNGAFLDWVVIPLGAGTKADLRALEKLYGEKGYDRDECLYTVATGYGRKAFRGADREFSELGCHARGVHHLIPEAGTVVDVGGQDLKVLRLTETGSLGQFVMNDKCAAGTGRFLEVMSRVMDLELNELGRYDAEAAEIQNISSTCTVFAETEVISLLAGGVPIENIVAGVHDAVARKISALAGQVGVAPALVVTGGGALNAGLVRAIERKLGLSALLPDKPQLTGAIGAALIAREQYQRNVEAEGEDHHGFCI